MRRKPIKRNPKREGIRRIQIDLDIPTADAYRVDCILRHTNMTADIIAYIEGRLRAKRKG